MIRKETALVDSIAIKAMMTKMMQECHEMMGECPARDWILYNFGMHTLTMIGTIAGQEIGAEISSGIKLDKSK